MADCCGKPARCRAGNKLDQRTGMKRYFCGCGNEIHFENTYCNVCHGEIGFIPELQQLQKLDALSPYKTCQHRNLLNCNWQIHNKDNNPQCIACRLTRTIPNLANHKNLQRWSKLEATKRRAFYMLLKLQLPIPDRSDDAIKSSLIFDFLEDKRSNKFSEADLIYTGHHNGIITINVAEADDSFRRQTQQEMKEAYRTLLGHFRHELGHFYWMQFQNSSEKISAFRQVFGDERNDYQIALKRFYRHGAISDWENHYISAYSSAHPLEDWAECWAHYLHILETLETAKAFGLINCQKLNGNFADNLNAWMNFSVVLNALNRSLGVNDPYPFVINPSVEQKLHFIDDWIKSMNGYQ